MNFIDQQGFDNLQQSLDDQARSRYEPSFTSGSAGALFTGAANGFSQISTQATALGYDSGDGNIGDLLGLNASNDPAAYPSPETIRQTGKWAADNLRPDPQTTGTMAQVLFGVGDTGARFAAGLPLGGVLGGALTSGTSVGRERYEELAGQGVDPADALKASGIRGGATALGALLPGGVGSSLLARVGSGIGINVAAGAAGRAAEGAVLKGYKQGDELKAFHAQDVAVDAILGGIFGGVSRLGIDVTHDQYDAALALKNAKSFNIDAMPGAPETVGDVARHAKVMDSAIDDILNDRPVSVDAESGGVKFSPREQSGEPSPSDGILPELQMDQLPGENMKAFTQRAAAAGVGETYHLKDGTEVRAHILRNSLGEPSIVLHHNGANIGELGYTEGGVKFAPVIRVNDEYQRRGAATLMYDLAQENGGWIGEKNDPNAFRSESGAAVRAAYEPGQSKAFRSGNNAGEQSYADIVKSVFDEEGYSRIYDEMTAAEARAGQIDRSQSQFAPEEVPEVPDPSEIAPPRDSESKPEAGPSSETAPKPESEPPAKPAANEQFEPIPDDFVPPEFGVPFVETRPTITSKQGTEWLDTRGMGETLHGSSFEVNPNNTHYSTMNIYGQGFYTTDAADIAEGYSRKGKGGTPTLYRVKVKGDPKMLDMEAALPPEVHAMVKDVLGDIYPHEVLDTGSAPENLREIYNEVRGESESNGLSADDVQEYFDSIRYNLEKDGYRGFTHVGGIGTNSKAHSVKIFWHPEDDVKLTKLGTDELKPGWQPAEERQVPTEFGKTEPASEIMASADQAVHDATTEGKAYDAAVDCFLSRGN